MPQQDDQRPARKEEGDRTKGDDKMKSQHKRKTQNDKSKTRKTARGGLSQTIVTILLFLSIIYTGQTLNLCRGNVLPGMGGTEEIKAIHRTRENMME